MDSEQLLALAVRCEQASGADRELDGLIDAAVHNRRAWTGPGITVPADEADYYEAPEGGARDAADLHARGLPLMKADHPQGEWARGPNDRAVLKNQSRRQSAHFTASLDAAKSLWPAGWYIRVTQIRFGMWQVEGWRGDKSVKTPTDVEAISMSEECARTAASLRALAASMKDGTHG